MSRLERKALASAVAGSQRLLQAAVNYRPELLQAALRRVGAIGRREPIRWVSPLEAEGFREYRDAAALAKLLLAKRVSSPLAAFWPSRGPVWDALGIAGKSRPILVEAKAHIPEALSAGTRASEGSRAHIGKSLDAARKFFAPRSRQPWLGHFYQYANRLAYHYFLRQLNGIESSLVFLYFTNAADMDGPATEAEWHGAIRLIHAAMGLRPELTEFGIYHAFVDARHLADAR